MMVTKVTVSVTDKVSMPANGGTTCRFMRPRALTPPTVQLGNAGIDKKCVDVKLSVIDLELSMRQQGASNYLCAA